MSFAIFHPFKGKEENVAKLLNFCQNALKFSVFLFIRQL
jgi:hypothetical protein